MGLFTLEEVRFSQTGAMWTTGPGTYKIPGFADIPAEFYIHLLRDAPNEHAIYSSKVHRLFKSMSIRISITQNCLKLESKADLFLCILHLLL